MRDVYYQSVENPVQVDRLPHTIPELRILPRNAEQNGSFLKAVQGLLLSGIFVVIPLIVYRAPGWSWLEPYDLLYSLPVMIYYLAIWWHTPEVRRLLHPAFLTALILVFVNHRTPWVVQILIVVFGLGVFIYAFGRHWSVVCTASPMPRDVARRIQRHCQENLFLLSSLTAMGIAALLWFAAPVGKILFLALPLAALFIPLPSGLNCSRWQVLQQSIGSWFFYRAASLPGLVQSPAGEPRERWAGAIYLTVLSALICLRWGGSPLPDVIAWGLERHQAIGEQSTATGFQIVRQQALIWMTTISTLCFAPPCLAWVTALSASMPVLIYAALQRESALAGSEVAGILTNVRDSQDTTERTSIYLGQVAGDSSPVLVPRKIFEEHAHGLGDSGSGKTSLFLCPIIEQLVAAGDCSLIVMDFKADTLELLATLQCAAAERVKRGLLAPPLKVFSNQRNKQTFAFNPMTQPFWKDFDLLTRTDILCAANGLNYGSDYGQGYYSSANAAILYHTLKTFPLVTTFTELAECIATVMVSPKKRDLNPEIRKAGVHVQEVIKRLAACAPLNVTSQTGHPSEVADKAIDLTQVFLEPQLLYFHLPATLSPGGAPEIGRLANYMLLAAATQTQRKHPVFLIIDEFQRMVAANLEYMLQLARSMGVGVILANQSMEDLKKGSTNLIPPIEANCRLRQWFSVSSKEDQQRLIQISGETVEIKQGFSFSTNHEGQVSRTNSFTEEVANRFTVNDILTTSDHPFRSFLRISRGAGYAQYGGLPVIVESAFHISEEEYRRRRSLPWPILPGSFLPSDYPSEIMPALAASSSTISEGPQWTDEVIASRAQSEPISSADEAALGELFAEFDSSEPPALPASKRRGRKRS